MMKTTEQKANRDKAQRELNRSMVPTYRGRDGRLYTVPCQ